MLKNRAKKIIKGFSLIELLVVSAIIALLFQLSFLPFGYFTAVHIHHELLLLKMRCEYAAQQAMVSGKNSKIIFDAKQQSYYWHNEKYVLPSAIVFGYIPGTKGPPSHPVYGITEAISFPQHCINLESTGFSQAGTVYLTDTQRHYLYALTIPIGSTTMCRLYRYEKNNGEKWRLL